MMPSATIIFNLVFIGLHAHVVFEVRNRESDLLLYVLLVLVCEAGFQTGRSAG